MHRPLTIGLAGSYSKANPQVLVSQLVDGRPGTPATPSCLASSWTTGGQCWITGQPDLLCLKG